MAHPRSRSMATAAAAAVALLLVSSCVSGTGGGVPAGSPSSAPTGGSVLAVVPASGPLITREPLTLHVPTGYGQGVERAGATRAMSGDACSAIEVSDIESEYLPQPQVVRAFTIQKLWSSPPEQRQDVTIDGWNWFHLHGLGKGDLNSDDITVYGTYRDGRIVSLWLERKMLNECGLPAADIEAEWASVLATVRWR